ncbi:MAG TPA: hypothetical protein VJ227_01200 [Patescibacteria group bacterium]|nr:hypothetical protein [Patescibacteria group bacterium]
MTEIPGETPKSWGEMFLEQALKNIRKHPHPDPLAQERSEYWLLTSPQMTPEKAHAIGMLWLTKILGVSQETAYKFAGGDIGSSEVGLLHAGVNRKRMDYKSFWTGVYIVVPEMARDGDINYLLKKDKDASFAWEMIHHIDYVNPRNDFLTTHIVTNKLLYS